MSGIKNNRRTQLTKKIIKESFLQLLATEPLEKISVAEICRRADVNRGTFYTHFTDTAALYQEIQDDLFNEIQPHLAQAPVANLEQWLENLLTILERHHDVAIFITSDARKNTLLKKIFSEVYQLATKNFQALYATTNPLELDYYFSYYSIGTIGTIADWLEKGRNIPVADLAKILTNVLQRAAQPNFAKKIN